MILAKDTLWTGLSAVILGVLLFFVLLAALFHFLRK